MIQLNETYLDRFGKQKHLFVKPINYLIEDEIAEAVDQTAKCIQTAHAKGDFCIFSSDSLLNVIRRNDPRCAYVNESEQVTASVDELQQKLKRAYVSHFKHSKLIIDNIEDCISFESVDAIDGIGGVVAVQAVVDLAVEKDVNDVVKLMSRNANVLGYNLVSHELTSQKTSVEYAETRWECCKVLIQFEGSYVNAKELLAGKDYVYHVAAKSQLKKIMKKGLAAGNQNAQKFEHPARVYCFVDDDRVLQQLYAKNAKKASLKFVEKDRILNDVRDWFVKCMKQKSKDGLLYDTKEFVVLRVDLAKLQHVRFYIDGMFRMHDKFQAVYTSNSISPKALAVVGEFHV